SDVDQLLRRTHRATVVEGERHHALALALELPPGLVMLGYRYATDGELPEVDDRREVGTPSSPERVGGKQAREAMRLDAEAARLMVESQGPDGSFWHTCALALHRATVPERFQAIFGITEGNGSLLLDRAREYVRSRGLLGPQGEVVADDLLAEFLGQRRFDFPAMAKLVRTALDIPALTDGEIAAYTAGDSKLMARIAQGFISGVIDNCPWSPANERSLGWPERPESASRHPTSRSCRPCEGALDGLSLSGKLLYDSFAAWP